MKFTATFSNDARTKKSKDIYSLYKNVEKYLVKNPSVTATIKCNENLVVELKIEDGRIVDFCDKVNFPSAVKIETNLFGIYEVRTFIRSEYPYDCTAKDHFPNAPIYSSNGTWLIGYGLIASKLDGVKFYYRGYI